MKRSFVVSVSAVLACVATVTGAAPASPRRELFDSLSHDIRNRQRSVRYYKQAVRAAAAIVESDRDPGKGERFTGRHDLYLVDTFGNRIHLATLPDGLTSLDPIPLRPRKRPPVIPTRTQQARADQPSGVPDDKATISVMNIYEAEFPLPKGTKIKSMRVIQVHPKSMFHMFNPEVEPGLRCAVNSVSCPEHRAKPQAVW